MLGSAMTWTVRRSSTCGRSPQTSAIADDVVEHLRSCYRAATTRFDYQEHDVLIIDNMLTAYGREPFTGPRKIAVAMAEPSTEHVPAPVTGGPASSSGRR
jgi:Taurine catabolism dioxygenase TauD, TfdA family